MHEIRPARFDYVPVAIVSYGLAVLIGVGIGVVLTVACLVIFP